MLWWSQRKDKGEKNHSKNAIKTHTVCCCCCLATCALITAAAAAAAFGCPIEDMVNESIILFYAVYFTTARVVHIIQQLGANYLWRCFALDYSNYQLVDEKHIEEYFKK